MADMENKVDGIEAIGDDELEAASGGKWIFTTKKQREQAKKEAAADGRTHLIPSGTWMCVCSHQYKYARDKQYIADKDTGRMVYKYQDCMCYYCGKTAYEVKA